MKRRINLQKSAIICFILFFSTALHVYGDSEKGSVSASGREGTAVKQAPQITDTVTNKQDNETMDEPEDTTESVTHVTEVHYTVKKGDTLWGISKRFNDDPQTWPDMWKENSREFLNPHLIYPGQKIRLFVRQDTDKYETGRFKGDEDAKKAEAAASLDMKHDADQIKDETPSVDLPFYHYSKIEGIGFMREAPLEPHGYIFKVKGVDRIMISKGDEVYIKDNTRMPLAAGARYFTYQKRTPASLKKVLAKKDKKAAGAVKKSLHTQYYITGIVEVRSKKDGYATAKVIHSFKTIRLKDFLMPYRSRSPRIPLTGSVKGLTGKMIISEENEAMFAQDMIAFIDKGKKDGVLPGQMYNVFYPEEKDSSELFGGTSLFIPIDFAKCLVLHSEETTSTVLIVSSEKSIAPGDAFRAPEEEKTPDI